MKILKLILCAFLCATSLRANTLQSYPTVTVPANDDYLYVQGATNSIRKLSPLYYLTTTGAAAAYQPLAANLTAWAALATSAKANASHTHALSDLTASGATSGQVPQWNGTAWVPVTPSGGSGSVAWGAITGTLSSQSDLQTALNAKAALAALAATNGSGVNNGGLVHWTQLVGVPAGFADGTDDGAGGGSGTVTSIADGSTNGVTWTITSRTSTPVFNFTLGAITPTSVNGVAISGSGTLAVSGTASVSGANTGDQTTITGNAGSATILQTGRTISITGDLSYTSPSFNGSGNVTAAATLPTVNSTVGTFTNATVTVDAKGRVTSASTGSGGGGGGSTDTNIAASWTTTNTRLTTVGDSLSSTGFQGLGSPGTNTWQYKLLQLSALSGKVVSGTNIYVNATGGAIVGTRIADYNTYVKPNRPAANGGTSGVLYSPLILWIGTNDAWASDPATFETDLNSYITTAKSDGFSPVILLTGKDSALLTSDTMRSNLQAIIERANRNQLADYIFPAHLLFPNNSDTNLVNDGTHLQDNGNALLANRLNAWFLRGCQFIAPVNLAAARGIDSDADRALLSNTNLLNKSRQYAATQGAVVTALTDGTTVAWDGVTIPQATLTLTGTGHVLLPIGSIVPGATYTLAVKRTSTQTLGFNAAYIWKNGTTPTQSTSSLVVDVFKFRAAEFDPAYIVGEHFGNYTIPLPAVETTLVEENFNSLPYEGARVDGAAPNVTNTPGNDWFAFSNFGPQRGPDSQSPNFKVSGGGGTHVVIDVGTTNANAQALFKVSGNGAGIFARAIANTKGYKFYVNANDAKWYLVQTKDDNSDGAEEVTILGQGSFTPDTTSGDTIRLECNGTNLIGKLNGTEVVNVTDSTYTTSTVFGITTLNSGSAEIDNFKVTTY